MSPQNWSWLDEEEELQVFVPGLMATGILVSIAMLIWDGIKRFLPEVGRKQHAIRLLEHARGRTSDLTSIESGESPAPTHVRRVRRSRVSSLLMSFIAFIACGAAAYVTLAAYHEDEGALAGRGWTLSMGLLVAGSFAWLGAAWLLSSLRSGRLPDWMERAHRSWPLGVLPEPSDGEA